MYIYCDRTTEQRGQEGGGLGWVGKPASSDHNKLQQKRQAPVKKGGRAGVATSQDKTGRVFVDSSGGWGVRLAVVCFRFQARKKRQCWGVEGGASCMYSKQREHRRGGKGTGEEGGQSGRPQTPAHRLGATSALEVRFSGGSGGNGA